MKHERGHQSIINVSLEDKRGYRKQREVSQPSAMHMVQFCHKKADTTERDMPTTAELLEIKKVSRIESSRKKFQDAQGNVIKKKYNKEKSIKKN